ncbi:acyl-CoA dehydrogenase [Candidatus Caldarchaeum subterraneum]|uniref:Acyl-CoA dehydrogenase n=1 Tax=Caldiarchaeum subterraneum TaxID=311458 RepID=E6N886_CALS0|nr:acyl-CoA dehydrogenase domain protein [Candidatus Caldarchaeum subterraneum]BAJ48505.1 acyl-CoA dehydrogenase [Candidatus Caldarchaeum subterraneum]BAJ51259.1 acyl-CoA dehydrogenase [Candidatus Caldarchaeum subterraneum]GBC72604.1 Acyl-CoA dehydrogenase [archaeon HR03]
MVFPFSSVFDFAVEVKEEYEIFRKSVRAFAEKEIEPLVKEIERTNTIPKALLKKAAEQGYLGLGIPETYDGQGTDMMYSTLFVEEVSRICPAFTVATLVGVLFTYPVMVYGTEEQKRKYLPPIARGEKFAAHATTEPGAGTDVAGIETTAKRKNGGWEINGRKYFISGADKADYFIVLARTSPPPSRKERHKGLSFFIVERGTPGFRVGEKIEVIGIRGSHPCEVILDNVYVPEENMVGEEGQGFKIAMDTYDHGRIGVAAQAVGVAQACLEKTLQYSLQRRVFERPLIYFQAVQFHVSEMLTMLEGARLMLYWATTLANKNRPEAVMAASMAKLYATEVAEKAALKAITVHGGVGVATDGLVERFLRDSQVFKIYEGANDIQKLVILRQMMKTAFGMDVD